MHKSNDRALKIGFKPRIFVSTENGTRSFWRLNRFLIHALELKLWHVGFFRHLKPYSGPWKHVVCWLRSWTLMLRTLDRVPGVLHISFFFSLFLIDWHSLIAIN